MTPLFLILRLAGLVFLIELLIMFGLHAMQVEDMLRRYAGAATAEILMAFFDALVLILVTGPAAYYWVVRPYAQARNKAEAALRASEERFRGIFDNSPSAISLKDLNGCFRLVNPRFEEWYGVSADEVVGKTSQDIFDAKSAEFFMAQDRSVLESDEVREDELEVTFANGRPHTIVSTKFPVRGADGRTVGTGTISTDVGERRRLEEQLRRSHKMEAVGRLAGGVAHEFNTLLMIILGNADMLGAELEGNDAQRSQVDAIERAARRGGQLAQQLLAYSRRKALLPETTDVNEHAGAVESLLRPTLGEAIELEVIPGEDLWLTKTDPGQFQEALLNLVLNSRDAMPEGGKVTIETANVRFDETHPVPKPKVRPGDYVMLAVGDTGCGMPPEVVARAIDPFFTTKEVGKGTGLGLSMVHGFAEQSGGFAWIESEEGRGATVRLYLPRDLDKTKERPPAAQDGLELERLPNS